MQRLTGATLTLGSILDGLKDKQRTTIWAHHRMQPQRPFQFPGLTIQRPSRHRQHMTMEGLKDRRRTPMWLHHSMQPQRPFPLRGLTAQWPSRPRHYMTTVQIVIASLILLPLMLQFLRRRPRRCPGWRQVMHRIQITQSKMHQQVGSRQCPGWRQVLHQTQTIRAKMHRQAKGVDHLQAVCVPGLLAKGISVRSDLRPHN